MNLPKLSVPLEDLPLHTDPVDTVNGLLVYLHPNGQGGFDYKSLRPSVGNTLPTTAVIPVGTITSANDPGTSGQALQDANYLYLYHGTTWTRYAKPQWNVNLNLGNIADEPAMLALTGLPGRLGFREDLKTYVFHTSGDGSNAAHWLTIQDIFPNTHTQVGYPADNAKPSDLVPTARDTDFFQSLNTDTGVVSTFNPVNSVWHRQEVVINSVPAGIGSAATPYLALTIPAGFTRDNVLSANVLRYSGTAENGITVLDVSVNDEVRAYFTGVVQVGGELQVKSVFQR